MPRIAEKYPIMCETDAQRVKRIAIHERQRRETLLREIGAIEGMDRIVDTLCGHLDESISTIHGVGFTPDVDLLGVARDLAVALIELLSDLREEIE